jgi:class 3 adenylate cyclase
VVTCGGCGAALAAGVCSVLFCDLVGFAPLSEARDPEAVRELLSRYFTVGRTVVGRYGGVAQKVTAPAAEESASARGG